MLHFIADGRQGTDVGNHSVSILCRHLAVGFVGHHRKQRVGVFAYPSCDGPIHLPIGPGADACFFIRSDVSGVEGGRKAKGVIKFIPTFTFGAFLQWPGEAGKVAGGVAVDAYGYVVGDVFSTRYQCRCFIYCDDGAASKFGKAYCR